VTRGARTKAIPSATESNASSGRRRREKKVSVRDGASSRARAPRAPHAAESSTTAHTSTSDVSPEMSQKIAYRAELLYSKESAVDEKRPQPIAEQEIEAFLREQTKLTEIEVVDIREKASWTNAMVFGVGASARQLLAAGKAVSTHFKDRIAELIGSRECIEAADDWVLVDCGSVVVRKCNPCSP
jgi:ribosomal silencing factor RsfS